MRSIRTSSVRVLTRWVERVERRVVMDWGMLERNKADVEGEG